MVLAWMGTIALCTLIIMMMQHGGGCTQSLKLIMPRPGQFCLAP
jgi:hypothetical protein